jgi:nucleotide-binding universal stress UspA family protein
MSYKTILLHVNQSVHAPERMRVAARLARNFEAHLVGAAASGISMEIYRNTAMMFAGPIPQQEFDELARNAELALDQFEAVARAEDVHSFERRVADYDPQAGLVLQARYADLVVLSQADREDASNDLIRDMPEHVALHGGRPVLVVPYAGKFDTLDRHALVAWDGSRSATRAMTDALPLLCRSRKVTLALFNPTHIYGAHGELPGADAALFLARHGVKVEVLQQTTPDGMDTGNALLSLAADLSADLLVMGAYGHTRWRETLLGGVTRTVLSDMTLPVLMSH